MKQWLKKNVYALISFFFIWLVPLAFIFTFAIQRKTSIMLWASVVLFVLIIIYGKKINQVLHDRIMESRIRDGYVPALWRVVQMLRYVLSMGIVIFAIYTIKKEFTNIFEFLIVIGSSGIIGYVFLIIDSIKKTPPSIEIDD